MIIIMMIIIIIIIIIIRRRRLYHSAGLQSRNGDTDPPNWRRPRCFPVQVPRLPRCSARIPELPVRTLLPGSGHALPFSRNGGASCDPFADHATLSFPPQRLGPGEGRMEIVDKGPERPAARPSPGLESLQGEAPGMAQCGGSAPRVSGGGSQSQTVGGLL